MDRGGVGGEAGGRGLGGCAEGRDCALQVDELHQAKQRQEVQRDGEAVLPILLGLSALLRELRSC